MRERFHTVVRVLLLCGTASTAQSRYFPTGSLDDSTRGDQFVHKWYSKQLKAGRTVSLDTFQDSKGTIVPISMVANISPPIAIRVDVNPDGTSRLTIRMTSGAGGYDPGHVAQSDASTLTKERTDWFLGKIQENKFWDLATRDQSRMGLDGAPMDPRRGEKTEIVTLSTVGRRMMAPSASSVC